MGPARLRRKRAHQPHTMLRKREKSRRPEVCTGRAGQIPGQRVPVRSASGGPPAPARLAAPAATSRSMPLTQPPSPPATGRYLRFG